MRAAASRRSARSGFRFDRKLAGVLALCLASCRAPLLARSAHSSHAAHVSTTFSDVSFIHSFTRRVGRSQQGALHYLVAIVLLLTHTLLCVSIVSLGPEFDNVETGQRRKEIRFDSPLLSCQSRPAASHFLHQHLYSFTLENKKVDSQNVQGPP